MRSSFRLLSGVAIIAAAVCLPGQAMAQSMAITGTQTGNQIFTGTLGQFFDTTSSLGIISLAAFDSGSNGFDTGTTITVSIFNRVTQTLVPGLTQTFTSANPGVIQGGSFRYKNLVNTISLPAGQYALLAWGYNAFDRDYNTFGGASPFTLNTFSGVVSYGSSAYGITAATYPTITEAPSGRYGFASFATGAPEPGTFALLGLGMVAGLIARRRRS